MDITFDFHSLRQLFLRELPAAGNVVLGNGFYFEMLLVANVVVGRIECEFG